MKDQVMNIEASIRARLQNKAKETNRPFSEVLQYYGMERFLYRFSRSPYAGKFILKGALLFTVWDLPQRRTTLDIDFLARYENQIAKIESVIKDVCAVLVVADGLVFDPKTVIGRRIKEDADYEGVRIKFTGFLERSRISMQVDVGFGDVIYPGSRALDYPVILDLPQPHIKGYPVESVVSEKFEAMIKLGSFNSRMKDFYDLWIMMHQFTFEGAELAEALKRTFEHRKTSFPERGRVFEEEIYDEGSDRQMLWKAFLTKSGIKHAPEKLLTVAEEIDNFMARPLDALRDGMGFGLRWQAAGPWI